MDPRRVDVVLVRPARPANVAAACRAMKNMGLGSLVLVDAPPVAEPARALAYGAWDVLDAARHVDSLPEAVGGATLVAATSGRKEDEAWTPRRFASVAPTGLGRVAIVFGPEATGLRRDELDLCPWRIHIPTAAAHSSLNLSQAVMVVAYEIHLSAGAPPDVRPEPAPQAAFEGAVAALGEALLAVGYLNAQAPDAILAELRRLLARAAPTAREVALLRGLARQVQWAGRVTAAAPAVP
ncbi:MAG: TrmH family RNA methyltransferase [Vicinamibacteria bacterium]